MYWAVTEEGCESCQPAPRLDAQTAAAHAAERPAVRQRGAARAPLFAPQGLGGPQRCGGNRGAEMLLNPSQHSGSMYVRLDVPLGHGATVADVPKSAVARGGRWGRCP